MEEGLLTKSILDEPKLTEDGIGNTSANGSSPTIAVVFSTLVALCGSFCIGCIVSTAIFSLVKSFFPLGLTNYLVK